MGSLSLLQRIFPTQGSNPGLLHCRQVLYQLSHREAQEYWSGLPIPSPADLPDLGIQVALVVSDSVWPVDCARQAPLSMGFSRQESWSGLPFPPPGGPLHPGIEPGSHEAPDCRQIPYYLGPWGSFPGGSDGKASVYNAGDLGSIPGSGRSPGEANGNPLQCSCLENCMDRGAW